MKQKNYLLFTIFYLFPFLLMAHSGVHEHRLQNNRVWHNGVTHQNYTASFLYYTADKVVLEATDGQVISLLISQLIASDQHFVLQEQKRISAINANRFAQFKSQAIMPNEQTGFVERDLLIFLLLTGFVMTILVGLLVKMKKSMSAKKSIRYSSLFFLVLAMYVTACNKSSVSATATSTIINVVFNTNPKSIDSAFSAYKPAVTTSWDNNYFYISSNGLPAHNMMVGITAWQQQVPVPQAYTGSNVWSIPLNPSYAATPLSTKSNLMKGAVAVAVNGIPIFNALNNRGEDSYAIGELDQWGGHCGKADDYHYHAAPLHLQTTSGLKPIAFALDGFAVYATKEPDGSAMSSLDTCHGHVGVNGIYHYHGTATYPYVVGSMKGKVSLDPSTTAPENQILPQALTKPIRAAGTPLTGAAITNFVGNGTSNGYLLEYTIAGKKGSINYSWNSLGKYNFIFTDINGNISTQNY